MWYPKDFVYSERTGPKRLGCRHRGQPCLPRSLKNSAAVPHLAIFPMLFSLHFPQGHYSRPLFEGSQTCLPRSLPRTPQPFLTSRLLRHPFSTLSTRTVVPTAIRTFVLHPVALLASNPSSKNSAAAPHLRFFRRLFTVFHGTVKSAGLHPSVQLLARGLAWKGCIRQHRET